MTEEMQVQIVGMKGATNSVIAVAFVIGLGLIAYFVLSYLQTPKSEAQH